MSYLRYYAIVQVPSCHMLSAVSMSPDMLIFVSMYMPSMHYYVYAYASNIMLEVYALCSVWR